MKNNIILNTDSYKNDHERMIKENVEYIYDVITPRKQNESTSQIVNIGQQYLLREYLSKPITKEMIDLAEIYIEGQGFTFNRKRWEYILKKHKGFLPLKIKALPEGTIIPVNCPVLSVVNTDPKCKWLTGYIEPLFLRAMWFPSTIASNLRFIKKVLKETLIKHTGNDNGIQYLLHNFGCRGASSFESSNIAGMVHAVFFNGSDDLYSNYNIHQYYNTNKFYTSSVIASEHSVSSSNSDNKKNDDFLIAVKMLDILEEELDKIDSGKKGNPIVSIVADTYNVYRFTRDYLGGRLKDRIVELGKRGGKVVVRPDSGDPIEMPISILEILLNVFGYEINEQGYKVLPKYIGLIQGDGIDFKSIPKICERLEQEKISISNILFGMGGKLTHPEKGRDDFSYAMKAVAQYHENHWEELFKNPITDIGKKSLQGLVTTFRSKSTGKIFADRIELLEINDDVEDMMVEVYNNGYIFNEVDFDTLRKNANK